MAYSDFDKLKVFIFVLTKAHFHAENIPPKGTVTIKGQRFTVDRAECFNLLRAKDPTLKGLKDEALIEHLKDYKNVKNSILGKFVANEGAELNQALEGRFVIDGEAVEQADKYEITPEQTPANAPQTTPGATAGGMPGMGLPSGPVISPRPGRVVFVNQPTPQPQTPKIALATSEGKIAEKPGSTLFTENKAGTVTEHPLSQPNLPKGPGPETPKLILARENGSIIETKTPPSKIAVARSDGRVFGEHTIKTPSFLKTFGSNTQIFAKKNLGRIGRGIFGAAKTGLESANPFLGRMGTGLVSNLTTIANPGGFGGGSRSIFGKFNRFGRGGRQTVSSFGKNVKSKKWLLFLFGILGFMMLVGGLTIIGGNNPTGVIPIAPSPGGGDITSCTFYRGGDGANAGMKLNNPAMAGLFTDISDKVGVPAAILAGIMRVESPSAFSSTADYLTNDYEAKSSEEGAIGIMQFMPGTFTNIFNSYSSDLKTLFNKTSVKNTVDPQNSMAPANVFRIYSIRDSITAAALKIKTDKLPGDWNENTVRDIASMYYSGARLTDPSNCTKYDTPEAITAKKKQDPNYNPCVSGPYDYGDDLWKSYNSCQSSSNPLPGGKPNIKFYCEDDPAWQYACSINYYGCGPSSTAIVVSSLGLVKTPVEIDQMFRDTGARSCGNYGSTMSLFFSNSTWFNDNFTYQYLALNADGSLNLTQAKEYLDNGYLIVASSHQFPCPNPGGCGPGSLKQGVVDHIFAIDDVNINQNLVHVEDPVNCRPEHTSQYDSNQWISNKLISLIPDSVEYNKSHPWFFAAAIKRKGN